MRDNPERDELDPAVNIAGAARRISPSVLSCINEKTKEGCYRGSEVGTFHSRRDEKGPFSLRKSRESSKRGL